MDHRVNVVLPQEHRNERSITNTSFYENMPLRRSRNGLHVPGIGERVEVDDLGRTRRDRFPYKAASDEASTTGDEDRLHRRGVPTYCSAIRGLRTEVIGASLTFQE